MKVRLTNTLRRKLLATDNAPLRGGGPTVHRGSRHALLFPLYVLDAITGLRAGEILGLSWDDLSRDREGPLLKVRRRLLTSSEGLGLEEGTKTGQGMIVRLPELGEAVLCVHRKRELEERLKAGPK